MSRDLEKAFLEQGRRLFELCRLYIDGGLNPEEKDSLTKEIEDAFDKWEEIDNRALFDEITANLEEPMSEQHRKRYCFSLITPFGEYSSTTNPKWLIGKMQESIDSWQGDESARYKIETYKKQIEKANKKADKYLDIIKPIRRGEVANVLCEFAQIVYEYGILLDAAFVVHGLDLKQLQEKCGVWIRHFPIDELRVLDISYYVGSEALAEEYLSRLPQEQPEPQQEQQIEPQQEKPKPTRGRGRPSESFKDKMIEDANGEKLEKIHKAMAGKKGKDAALIILAAVDLGWLLRPTYTQVTNEFGDIGSKTGYNRYLTHSKFTPEEIDGAKKALSCQ